MKNLKRILSLALASVMVMGMMVVGASAAFNDQAEINPVNVNAVNTMVALGVINGKEGNQFDPKGNVTRAEMATMIAMSLNGGNADFRGTTTTGFTDVDGVASMKWAAKFIKYCVDQGILSGVGGGKFNPNANVTAQEAATMVLTAMGYKKEMLKSETSDWAAKINLKAEQRDLYEDTSITDYTQTIDRETAAQMIYNGITVRTPTITDQYNTTTGEHIYSVGNETGKPSILESAFKAHMEYAVLTHSTYNSNGTYTYTMDSSNVDVDPLAASNRRNITLTSEIDVSDLFMQKVKVIYSDSNDQVTANTTVIGITSVNDCVLSEGITANMKKSAARKTIDGFGTTNGTGSVITYAFNGVEIAANGWDEYKLIDNNDDGKADCIVAYPVTVAQVTGVSSAWLSTTQGRFAFDDNDIVAGLAIGDWVTIEAGIKVDNEIKALKPIENVTATAKTAEHIYTIGGEKYRSYNWTATTNAGVTTYTDGLIGSVITNGLGGAYTLVALNGYVFDIDEYEEDTAAAVKDVILVTKVAASVKPTDGTTVSGTTAYHEVIIMGADGKTQTVKVAQVDTKTPGTLEDVADSDNKVVVNKIYTYETTTDGYYKLSSLQADGSGKWEGYDPQTLAANTTVAGGKAEKNGQTTVRFKDNALVYVVAPKIDADSKTAGVQPSYYAVTGAEINKWDEENGTKLAASVAYTKTSSGFPYAELALLVLDNGVTTWPGTAASSLKFGYLTADTIAVYDAEAKATVAQLTIWNGEENVTRTATLGANNLVAAVANYPAGTMIAYKENGAKLADLTELTIGDALDGDFTTDPAVTEAVPGFVCAYDPARPNDIQIALGQTQSGNTAVTNALNAAKEYDIEDTVVIYIDDAKKEGTTGAITMAERDGTNDYVNNIYAVTSKSNNGNAGDTLVALFVDVNNKIAKQIPTKKITASVNNPTAGAGKYTVTVSGSGKDLEPIYVTVTRTAMPTDGGTDVIKLTANDGNSVTLSNTNPTVGTIEADGTINLLIDKATVQFEMGANAVTLTLTVTHTAPATPPAQGGNG